MLASDPWLWLDILALGFWLAIILGLFVWVGYGVAEIILPKQRVRSLADKYRVDLELTYNAQTMHWSVIRVNHVNTANGQSTVPRVGIGVASPKALQAIKSARKYLKNQKAYSNV